MVTEFNSSNELYNRHGDYKQMVIAIQCCLSIKNRIRVKAGFDTSRLRLLKVNVTVLVFQEWPRIYVKE
jgi:hypothetical protein